mmetsp:Transcript_20301/g.43340  ORF Transcript_20301/g.43340 Transcript_20301/m.43340 type:complete len:230 (-) Transcript_20301:141-830(-)
MRSSAMLLSTDFSFEISSPRPEPSRGDSAASSFSAFLCSSSTLLRAARSPGAREPPEDMVLRTKDDTTATTASASARGTTEPNHGLLGPAALRQVVRRCSAAQAASLQASASRRSFAPRQATSLAVLRARSALRLAASVSSACRNSFSCSKKRSFFFATCALGANLSRSLSFSGRMFSLALSLPSAFSRLTQSDKALPARDSRARNVCARMPWLLRFETPSSSSSCNSF